MDIMQRQNLLENLTFSPFPILNTPRLILRELRQSDEREIFALRSDKLVNQYLVRDQAKNLQDARAFIEKIQKMVAANEAVYWAICHRESQKLIGTILLMNIQKNHLRAEIGYELLPKYQHQGLMQEALEQVLKFAFEELRLHSIIGTVDPGNGPSLKILERNKFHREAHFHENYFYDGKFVDTAIYTLINPADRA